MEVKLQRQCYLFIYQKLPIFISPIIMCYFKNFWPKYTHYYKSPQLID